MNKAIKFLSKNWAEIILSVLVTSYVIVLAYLSIRRHSAFASSYDLANMDQTIWNTLNGNFFSLSGTKGLVSRFNFHASLMLVLLSPFYLIYNSVNTLLFLQSLLISLGAIPAFLLAKDVLKSKGKGLVVATAYLLNPGVQWTNIYDFHGVALAMSLLLAAFYSAYKKQWKLMYLFAGLSLLTKESASLAVLMLGFYLLLFMKEKARGMILILSSVAWFLVFVFFVIPHFSETSRFWAWDWFNFSDPGGSGRFDLMGIIKKFTAPEAINYYQLILKPFAFLPVIGFPWLFLAIPDFFINMLSSQGQMRSINFHYDSITVVGLVMATILGWKIIEVVFKKYKLVGWLVGLALLAATLRTNYNYSPLPTTPSHWRPMYEVGADEIAFEKVLSELPREASISSSSEVRAHVTHRTNSYNLPNMIDKVDYIAMVDQNRLVGDYNPKEFENMLIEKLKKDPEFENVFQQGHFYLFKRKTPGVNWR